ncbi:MAG: hypothetical protein QGG39_10505 [Candidatus Poribacteria bacterium]|nr:hypothetical protein [Candidatus Poribacteria bacterium]
MTYAVGDHQEYSNYRSNAIRLQRPTADAAGVALLLQTDNGWQG